MSIEQLLEKHEGKKNKPYRCSAGKLTIGIGHNMDSNPLPKDMQDYLDANGCITDDMIYALLQSDIAKAKTGCHLLFPTFDIFSGVRQDAFIDFIFNVGLGTARKFKKAIHAANIGHWDEAADEMKDSSWYHQVGLRGPAITEMVREG